MCQCEDRPCCGHPAEELADARYAAEREYERGWMSPEDEGWYEEEDEDWACVSCLEMSDNCVCANDSWGREDSALESSIFGDC